MKATNQNTKAPEAVAKGTKPMLAGNYESQNIRGWLMSEKLDGVRALWNGRELLSRNGNKFNAPEWFTRQLPTGVELDGELYLGRGLFQATVSVVKKKAPVDAEWRNLRYCVFDAPGAAGGFEQRLAFCASALAGCAVAAVVAHRACASKADMDGFFEKTCSLGGEGVMLRRPGSAYERKRSASLLKYKPFQSDEAEMVGKEPGKGRLKGTVGALILKWRDVVFKVGTGMGDKQRADPPRIGSRITFGYCGLTDGGVPRFPTFLGERSYE